MTDARYPVPTPEGPRVDRPRVFILLEQTEPVAEVVPDVVVAGTTGGVRRGVERSAVEPEPGQVWYFLEEVPEVIPTVVAAGVGERARRAALRPPLEVRPGQVWVFFEAPAPEAVPSLVRAPSPKPPTHKLSQIFIALEQTPEPEVIPPFARAPSPKAAALPAPRVFIALEQTEPPPLPLVRAPTSPPYAAGRPQVLITLEQAPEPVEVPTVVAAGVGEKARRGLERPAVEQEPSQAWHFLEEEPAQPAPPSVVAAKVGEKTRRGVDRPAAEPRPGQIWSFFEQALAAPEVIPTVARAPRRLSDPQRRQLPQVLFGFEVPEESIPSVVRAPVPRPFAARRPQVFIALEQAPAAPEAIPSLVRAPRRLSDPQRRQVPQVIFRYSLSAPTPPSLVRAPTPKPAVYGPSRVLIRLQQSNNTELSAALSFSGATSKRTSREVLASLSPSGAATKMTLRSLAGVLSFSAALAASVAVNAFLTAALSFSGAVRKSAGKAQSSDLSFSGAARRLVARALGASASPAGSLAKLTSRALSGALSFVGALGSFVSNPSVHVKNLTASLGFMGALLRAPMLQTVTDLIVWVKRRGTIWGKK